MTHQNTGKSPILKRQGRASEELTSEDKKALRRYLKVKRTMQAAADGIAMNRVTLYGISKIGSGSPESIAKIRQVIHATADA